MTAPTNSFMMDMVVVTTTFAERMQGRGAAGASTEQSEPSLVTSLAVCVGLARAAWAAFIFSSQLSAPGLLAKAEFLLVWSRS